METRYNMRMLGVPVDGLSLNMGDNMPVILNCTINSRTLKNYNDIAYHHVREDVDYGVIGLSHIRLDNNYSDLLTKALSGSKQYSL